MEDKYIPYSVDGREYKIPESEVDAFEKHYPSATIKMKVDDRLYNVPLDKKEEFTKYYTNASYALDDDSPSLGETIAKSTASAAVRTAKRGVDLFHVLSSNMPYYDPIDELYKMPESLDERLQDPNNKVRNASIHLGELADRLSKEADPTGGQKDFLELIGEGKLGKALQKGVATTLESSPNTLSARHWSTMLLNAAGMAAENYVEDTLNNPETEKWKRATYAIGSAAIEQAVEKFADPIFKYIGGNATGKLTKETAEEIIRQARNEATETIVKRIGKVLSNVAKNTGKDALGEGAEEVITSFGNDALGEALDAIDGDKDYGIRAQWEKLKEENPDAEIKDFALAKAKEYVNAFIGGAMSGGIMSGPTQTIAEASNAIHESEVNRQVSAGNTIGQELNIQNLYDVDENIKATSASVVQAFTDENGESIIDNTFIDELTSEDALALSRSRDISSEQRSALEKFAFARSMQEGLNQTLDAKVDNDVNKQKEIIEDVANNSQVVTGVYNGKRVYVKGGLARINGTIVLPDGKNGPVVIIDATTGQQTSVRSEDISRAVAHDAEEFGRMMEDTIRNADASVREQARNTMSPLAKKRAIQPFAGKKILVDLGNGITEVYVQQVSPNGNVILKGKKGDLGGQSIVTLNAETFYDSIYRDDTGNPVVTEVSKEEAERLNVREAEAPQQASASENAPESETTSEQRTASGADYRGESVTIIIDGVPVNVDVVSQDNVSDSIVYEYVDANGRTRRKSATIADFENAVLKAQQYTEANKPMEDTVSTEPAEEPATETPATEAPVTEAPVSEEPVVAEPQAPLTPESINWDELFEQDKEAFFAEIQNQFGDRAVTFLNKFIDFANKELEKLNKVNPTKFNDIIANENAIAAVQAKIDTLKEMADRLTPKESAPEASVVPTQPTTPEPPQQTPNVPDVSLDKASDARARGFRMTNGQRVDRREETAGVYGNDIEVAFAADSKGKRNGKIKVIDASNLVPSHISGVENVEHFLPEAQPKKRTDKASSVSASLIAQNMNNPQMTNVASSAYEGAPIVNRRGEVIQGNNRSAAILEMYQSHPENADAYKQYLIDHASEFGLTPEDVASMQNPVLVRELDVDDTDAITLGQYTMQDMESGGNQMIDSGRAIAGLNNKGLLEDFITRLLAEENDDTSDMNLSDLIIRNGNDALKMLFHNGIINQTQYQSAIGANGKITADARAALRGIIEQQLFAGGIDNISIMFEVLPDKAKKAIMQTIARELKNPDDAKVTPYLQEAIEVYYKLNQQSDFVAAKSEEDVDRAIKAFKGQTSLDEAGTPAEKYSNFAFVLAKQFKTKTLKQQRDLLNHLYDVIAGETNIFGESEGKTLADAVEEVYGTNLNKGNNETNGQSGAAVLEGGNGGSQEGQQGSAEGVGVRTNVGEGGQGTTNGGANQTVGRGNEAAGEVKPVAPNPVSDPIAEAKKIEMHLAIQLQRNLDDGQKEDLARNLGKKIGDLFATKEEYDSYQETATDFGAYNKFVEQGVESSFANRQPNTGNLNTYHIGQEIESEKTSEEATKSATDAVLTKLQEANIPVEIATQEMVNQTLDGILKTPNGIVYGWTDGDKIYLTEAGINPNTPIHEYTHLWADAMMRKNPKGWNSVKNLLKGTPVWNEVINDPNYSDIKDNENEVASEVLSRISGTKNAEKLEQMAQQMLNEAKGTARKLEAQGIIQRIKDALNKFWNWVGTELFGIENFESVEQIADRVLWDLMNNTDLDAPYSNEPTEIIGKNGDVIADTDGKGKVRFSISTWENGGRDYLQAWLDKDKTLAADEKADILARMDEFYENAKKYTDVYVPFGTWSDAAVRYDENGNPLMSVIKANGDYAMNLDFSLVCKKRRPLNRLLRTLINRNAFGTYSLREREIAEINWILQEHGFEVACALCFVDSRRYRVTGVADVFSSLYNKFVKALAPEGAEIAHFNYSSNPNVADVENGIDTLPDEQLNWEKFNELASKYTPTSVGGKVAKLLRENPSQRKLVDSTDFIDANGFEAVKENNQALLSLYNSKKGTGGPKASFGDVQYLNDILKKDKSFDVEKAYAVGGVRIQSFSDFVPHMYFDYMQLFAELSAKKLPAHAYTKEVLFAKIFGMTGLKINMSLVPAVVEGGVAPGLDANGNYAWADAIKDKDGNIIQQAQSFPYDEAMAIQNAEGYSKNCGVIAVGISDEHIEKMLDDENIPFIIPYHNSSLNAIVARMTNINKYKDYSKVQNTRHADGTKLDKGTKDFNFNAYLREHPNATPQQAAQAYLDWCKKHKYKPKFNQFAYHPNYYKLLVDFNTIDSITGEYTPQGPVSMTFPTEQNQFGNVETLIQQGLSEDAALEEKMDAEIDAIAEEVEERLKEIAKEPKLSQKKQAAAMAKLADERMAKINARAESNEEFDGILSRSGDITPEVDAEYLAAVESGDMEKAQQMVNEAYDRYLNEMLLPNDEDEVGFKYHRGPAPTKTFKRYAVLNVTPDGFKAAYAGNKTGTPVGVWLDAQNLASYTSDMVQFDDGTFATYIAGDTGAATNTKFSPEKAEKLGIKGSQKWLLERGGKHSSDVPNFSQMNLKVNEKGEKVASAKEGALPHNKLIFEIEYGISDDGDLTDYVRENGRKMKGKNQGLAKIGPNQYYDFKTNPNAVGNWGIGGTFRITRLVPHSEIVSVTEQYKKDAIAEANKLYESGKISQKDRDARIKSAESIQIQKWVGGYNPSDFGLTEESVKEMVEKGSRMKLTDAVTYDDAGNVIPLSERFNPEKKDMRYRRQDEQNTAIDRLTGEARNFAIENAVNEEAEKLGVKVTYKTRKEMPKGHQNDKGYYNTKTGEIVICTENATSAADAIQTILHEAVAHKGLRQLMGDKFNEFINRVYESLDAETKEKVDALARNNYNGDTAIAMEEYMATLAETTDFNNNSVWDKIKSIFEDIINAILGRNDIKIGDNELRYILRASYNNMVNPRGMESVAGWAQDQMMRDEYKINQSSPEILSRTGIDPNEVARETASATYDRVVSETWQEFQRQFQDAYQPVRIAIDAIQQETGNIPIEDYENYLLMQNQSSSRSRVEIDDFERKYYSPIVEQTNKIIDEIMKSRNMDPNDKEQRAQVYKEVTNYLIAKHGLERNAYYQKTKKRLLNAEEKKYARQQAAADYADELSKIASTYKGVERVRKEYEAKDKYEAALAAIEHETTADIRDYSGLTSLYGLKSEDFLMAEAQARKDVARFESMVATDSLWKAINAATDKTLRHTYESGLISRKQYEDIKAMFNFYIPLRGFDETTAEDVYSYSRFEGNRFNPTLQKVKGRTSLADDPLAIIMNMAESEIAQGNKNRAKQALYNFILNRVRVDENGNEYQNSLMQVEDVWYLKTVDSNGNDVYTIATPNHEIGESYEDFEKRMQSLAASDMAMKSKKGQVDVGMRFQKQMNKNAHYIYLKVNGVDKAIFINGNPKAAEAINGTHQQNKHFGEDKMRTLNRLISSSFTNYSLEFTARNYFRDMIYAHINIDVKESDPAYRKKFRQNWRHNNLGTMIKMLKAYRAGEFEGRQLTEDEAAFVEFMNNGGQTGYTLINSVERHKKELESAIENMRKGIIKGGVKDSTIFRYSLGAIELLNESSELVTRFAAFKTSRDMGRSVLKSISDAKEITVNFNTKGAQDGTGWMGFIAKYFGWSKYFFNASVQGVQNVTAMAKANTLKFCSVVGGVAATGFIMPIVMGAISELFGDDEDEYWNIPEYERQNNLCIPIPFLKGKYAKVPLPIGFREVYAIGDMVAAMAFDKKFSRDVKQVGMDIANKIAYVLLPVNPLESASNGLNFWHTFLYTALPSSAQFVIQNATNMDWKGAPLQKEYTYNAGDPQWMKAYASNPDWMKGLSKWCNEHIHPYGDYRGLDWSPEKLDNILSNMLGGIYSLIKKSGKTISMAWNEENRNLHNIPLAGVVLGSGIEDDDSFVTDTYFDMKAYYDSNIRYINRRAKQFGYDLDDVFIRQKGKHHPKMQEVYNNRIYDFMKEWYIGNKELQELDKEVKKVKKKVAATEYPSEQLLDKLIRKENKFASERRDFVNDMLEID